MPVLRMNLAEWEAYHARLADAFRPAAVRGVQSAAHRIVALLQERTRSAKPMSPRGAVGAVNTGEFLRGWRWTGEDDGALLYNDRTDRGPIQEHGRRPGARMPPKDVIETWLRQRAGMSAKEAKRAAYPVARAIARRGLWGRQILTEPSFNLKMADLVSAEILHELEAEVAKK